MQALLEYRSGKIEQSLAILIALDREAPGSPYVLNLMMNCYVTLQDWDKLGALIPALEKHKVVNAPEILRLRGKIAAHSLSRITVQNGSASALQNQWQSMDKEVKRNEEMTLVYMDKLLEFSLPEDALSVALAYLNKQWSDKVVLKAGYLETSEPGNLLVNMEHWIKERPGNPALMLSLGRVSLRNKLWGKAREYFESSLRFSKSKALSAQANAELARLMDHLGEHEHSASLYRKALAQLEHRLPELPMPE